MGSDPVNFKDTFRAGMSSTQRSEIIKSFFKAFVPLNITLKEFFFNNIVFL